MACNLCFSFFSFSLITGVFSLFVFVQAVPNEKVNAKSILGCLKQKQII